MLLFQAQNIYHETNETSHINGSKYTFFTLEGLKHYGLYNQGVVNTAFIIIPVHFKYKNIKSLTALNKRIVVLDAPNYIKIEEKAKKLLKNAKLKLKGKK